MTRPVLLVINYDYFDSAWVPSHETVVCPRGTDIWRVCRSEEAGVALVRCDYANDIEKIAVLRRSIPSLPIGIISSSPSFRKIALNKKCSFGQLSTETNNYSSVVSDASSVMQSRP